MIEKSLSEALFASLQKESRVRRTKSEYLPRFPAGCRVTVLNLGDLFLPPEASPTATVEEPGMDWSWVRLEGGYYRLVANGQLRNS